MANLILKNSTWNSWILKLFTNNITPSVTDTATDYTVCVEPGYADIAIDPTMWSGSTTAGVSTYNYPMQTFTITSNPDVVTIYGYYVLDSAGTLLFSDVFPTPVAFAGAGVLVNVTLTYNTQMC